MATMLAKTLQQIMKERHLTQTELAKQIGVTRPSISYWLKGSVPTGENLNKLCKFLNVEPSFLQYGISATNDDETTATITAMDRKPTALANDIDGNRGVISIRFSKEWINSRTSTNLENTRIFNITGASMSPTYEEGDLFIVDTSITQVIGNGIYILRQLGEEVVRRIQVDPDQKTVDVILDNPIYKNQKSDIDSLDIVGKVLFAYKRIINL